MSLPTVLGLLGAAFVWFAILTSLGWLWAGLPASRDRRLDRTNLPALAGVIVLYAASPACLNLLWDVLRLVFQLDWVLFRPDGFLVASYAVAAAALVATVAFVLVRARWTRREDPTAPTTLPDPLPAGTTLGGYVIESELARSPYGRVYLARHRKLPGRVAIVVLAVDRRDPDGMGSFMRRVRDATRTETGVLELGLELGVPYAVFRFGPDFPLPFDGQND